MRISDWSSDVCSSDLQAMGAHRTHRHGRSSLRPYIQQRWIPAPEDRLSPHGLGPEQCVDIGRIASPISTTPSTPSSQTLRSEEHTSELQSLMRISYAVFCLKKKNSASMTTKLHHQPTT